MRRQATQNGLTVQAIAGTHAVLLGFDVDGLDQLDAVDSRSVAPTTSTMSGIGYGE